MYVLQPNLEEVPAGDWYCPDCVDSVSVYYTRMCACAHTHTHTRTHTDEHINNPHFSFAGSSSVLHL